MKNGDQWGMFGYFSRVENRLDAIDGRMGHVERSVGSMQRAMDVVQRAMEAMQRAMEAMQQAGHEMQREIAGTHVEVRRLRGDFRIFGRHVIRRLADHGRRLDALERKAG